MLSAAIEPTFVGHGEVCVAKFAPAAKTAKSVTVAVTMLAVRESPACGAHRAIVTILIKFDLLQFDSNLRRNRFKFGKKLRFIAKDSFKPPC